MQEREMLDVIRSLAAEERRLRLLDDRSLEPRIAQIHTELTDMWGQLRRLRAEQSGAIELPEDIVLPQEDAPAGRDSLAS